MAEMSVAGLKGATAGFARSGLARDAHARIQRAIGDDGSLTVEVE